MSNPNKPLSASNKIIVPNNGEPLRKRFVSGRDLDLDGVGSWRCYAEARMQSKFLLEFAYGKSQWNLFWSQIDSTETCGSLREFAAKMYDYQFGNACPIPLMCELGVDWAMIAVIRDWPYFVFERYEGGPEFEEAANGMLGEANWTVIRDATPADPYRNILIVHPRVDPLNAIMAFG